MLIVYELDKHEISLYLRSFIFCVLTGDRVELSHEQLDDYINQNVSHDNVQWFCSICNNMSAKKKADVARHIEAKHVITAPLMCSLCSKPAKTRDSLRKHMANNHGGQHSLLRQ